MKHLKLLTAALVVTALAGCAEIQVYSSPNLAAESRTGIPFYVSKPYLLVARTGAKDKPVEVSLIHVPDLSHPLFAKMVPGWGSSDLGMTFTNSVLASVNQKSDPKIAELLGAVGGLPGSLANAAKTRKETSLLGNQAAPDYSAVAAKLRIIAGDLDAQLAEARKANALTELESTAVAAAAQVARDSADVLGNPATAESGLGKVLLNLKNVTTAWDRTLQAGADGSARQKAARRQIDALRSQLQQVLDSLSPKPDEPPTFTLYELDNSSGRTVLKEVAF